MMKISAKSIFLGILIGLTGCFNQFDQSTPSGFQRDPITSVVTTVTIDGNREAVFDIVTTARFWPEWHPATLRVGGVTQRPYQLGDRIHEQGRIGNKDYRITWKVIEHDRPSSAVIKSERSVTQVSYWFQDSDAGTVFVRELKYQLEDLAGSAGSGDKIRKLMAIQSEQAVAEVKKSIETILSQEKNEL